jgi:hypothetical protein
MGRPRLVVVVLAAALVLGGLGGCRSEPGSAAFVGDTRITTDQVDHILDEVKADGGKVDPSDEGTLRRQVASAMVFVEVAKRYVADQNLPAPQPDYQAVAARVQLPADDPLVRLIADSQTYLNLLTSSVPPAQLTEADYNATADLLVNQGVEGGKPAIVGQLKSGYAEQLAAGVGVRNALLPLMKKYDVTVNPRYGPASLALTSTQGGLALVALPLTSDTSASPAVVDLVNPE